MFYSASYVSRSGFQSTHLREVRPTILASFLVIGRFQSTHLREVRLAAVHGIAEIGGFNPRTYERCDPAHQ